MGVLIYACIVTSDTKVAKLLFIPRKKCSHIVPVKSINNAYGNLRTVNIFTYCSDIALGTCS
jgi:hypothetical protein